MSELGGVQQVLQLTPLVSSAQASLQPHAGDLARAFEKEMVKVNQEAHEKIQATNETAEVHEIKDEDSSPGQQSADQQRRHHHKSPTEEEHPQLDLIAESGHGGLLDIKA